MGYLQCRGGDGTWYLHRRLAYHSYPWSTYRSPATTRRFCGRDRDRIDSLDHRSDGLPCLDDTYNQQLNRRCWCYRESSRHQLGCHQTNPYRVALYAPLCRTRWGGGSLSQRDRWRYLHHVCTTRGNRMDNSLDTALGQRCVASIPSSTAKRRQHPDSAGHHTGCGRRSSHQACRRTIDCQTSTQE